MAREFKQGRELQEPPHYFLTLGLVASAESLEERHSGRARSVQDVEARRHFPLMVHRILVHSIEYRSTAVSQSSVHDFV